MFVERTRSGDGRELETMNYYPHLASQDVILIDKCTRGKRQTSHVLGCIQDLIQVSERFWQVI